MTGAACRAELHELCELRGCDCQCHHVAAVDTAMNRGDVELAIGMQLARARKRYWLAQRDLAELMKAAGYVRWSQATVWSVESGARPLRLSEAMALAAILGIPLQTFTAVVADR